MAILWNVKNKMGNITVESYGKKTKLDIYEGENCLAVFLHPFKLDNEIMYELYDFLQDKKHIQNLIKKDRFLYGHEVARAELNLFFKDSKVLLDALVKQGYKVKCYYKEVK